MPQCTLPLTGSWLTLDLSLLVATSLHIKVRTNSVERRACFAINSRTGTNEGSTVSSLICDRRWQSGLVTLGCHLKPGPSLELHLPAG